MIRFLLVSMLALLGLTACSARAPITEAELVGSWTPARFTKGALPGVLIFYANGTLETRDLPWGIISGNTAHLTSLESINGKWEMRLKGGEKVIWLTFESSKATGQGFIKSINAKFDQGVWFFRCDLGDPDLLDYVEFRKVASLDNTPAIAKP